VQKLTLEQRGAARTVVKVQLTANRAFL